MDVEVRTIRGSSASGSLVSLDSKGVVVEAGSEKTEIPVTMLMSVVPKSPPALAADTSPISIELVDGSQLSATAYTVIDNSATVKLVSGGAVSIATDAIYSVRLKKQEPTITRQWDEILDAPITGDTIVIRKTTRKTHDDTTTKTTSLDYHVGRLHDIDTESVQFELGGERGSVSRERVEGVIYYHRKDIQMPEPLCLVEDVGGSRWRVRSLQLDGEQLRIESSAGTKITLPMNAIRKIDFSTDKIIFLSDIKPDSVEWSSYLDSGKLSEALTQMYEPRRDQSFAGGKLQLRSANKTRHSYGKGLAIHSRTLLIYTVPDGFRRFEALAGIDAEMGEAGHVRLQISADTVKLFDETIAGMDDPKTISLDIRGARRLKILVDFGDDLDIADHLNLCEARIAK